MSRHLERARLLLERHRPQQAEPLLRRRLAEEPNDAEAHALLAVCLAGQRAFCEALAEAQQAVHLAPDDPYGHFVQALVLHDDKYWSSRGKRMGNPFARRNRRARLQRAQQSLSEALRLNPFAAGAYYLQASIHAQLEQRREALASVEQALAIDPADSDFQAFRVDLLRQMGRGDEADAAARSAMSDNPEHTDIHTARGWLFLQRGQPQEAIRHFREALRLDPMSDSARRGALLAASARNPIARHLTRLTLWFDTLTERQTLWVGAGIIGLIMALGAAAKRYPAVSPTVWIVAGTLLLISGLIWLRRSFKG